MCAVSLTLTEIMKSEAGRQKINRLQRDKDDPSSTLHCVTAITLMLGVSMFMHMLGVSVFMHMYVLCAGRRGDWLRVSFSV